MSKSSGCMCQVWSTADLSSERARVAKPNLFSMFRQLHDSLVRSGIDTCAS